MYRIETVGGDIDAAIEALPATFLTAYAELRAALEVAPSTVGRVVAIGQVAVTPTP